MPRRFGLQAEVLFPFIVVMLGAVSVLAIVLVRDEEVQLTALLSRALAAEARRPQGAAGEALVEGTHWWVLDSTGEAAPRTGTLQNMDAASLALAQEALRRRAALLRLGRPWEEIRFATPHTVDGGVAVARLPRAASLRLRAARRAVVAGVLLVDGLVFGAFGVFVLRRRLILPLRRTATAARQIASGDLHARVPEAGPRETVELAAAFNEMTAALAARTQELEKAVSDLRTVNRDLRTAQEGLHRSERLAAVGQLAAGVAHEIGNPAGALLAFLDLIGRDAMLSETTREYLVRAQREGERVRTILRQLLDFSRPPRAVREVFRLRELVDEVVALVAAQRRYAEVHIAVEETESVPMALGGRSSTLQILLNLLLNAADAVRDRPAAAVRILLRGAPLVLRASEGRGEPPARSVFDAVECEVRDNGPGIPEAQRERIFDAFFTTKEPGEGTGLGLASAVRLAEEQGGAVELRPAEVTTGASFVLRLPAQVEAVSGATRCPPAPLRRDR